MRRFGVLVSGPASSVVMRYPKRRIGGNMKITATLVLAGGSLVYEFVADTTEGDAIKQVTEALRAVQGVKPKDVAVDKVT